MKKLLPLFILTIISLPFFLPQHAIGKEEKSCDKSFMLKGKGPDGDYKEVKLTVKRRFNDYSPKEIPGEIEKEWKIRYSKSDFKRIADPSWKYNCAGYVFERLWHKGKYWFMADVFYDVIVKNFGKQISSVIGFGGAKMDDVVVWFNNKVPSHIAIVNGLDDGKIFIGTKDAQESVYAGTLSTDKENPLENCGTPWIYRIDTASVTVEEVSPGDCDGSPVKSKSGWVSESVIDPGKVQGTSVRDYTIDSISLDKIGITMPGNSRFTITFSGLPKVVEDGMQFDLTVSGSAEKKGDALLRLGFGTIGITSDKMLQTFDIGRGTMENKAVYKFTLPPGATQAAFTVSIYDNQGMVDLFYWRWKKKK